MPGTEGASCATARSKARFPDSAGSRDHLRYNSTFATPVDFTAMRVKAVPLKEITMTQLPLQT